MGPPVAGAKMDPEMLGNKYFSGFGQMWVIQSPLSIVVLVKYVSILHVMDQNVTSFKRPAKAQISASQICFCHNLWRTNEQTRRKDRATVLVLSQYGR